LRAFIQYGTDVMIKKILLPKIGGKKLAFLIQNKKLNSTKSGS
jgi:hypothetical protein